MNAKEVLFDTEARDKLMAGVRIMARAVSQTLGPRGRTAVIQREFGQPIVTKDGVSLARSISKLPDRVETLGSDLIKSVSEKANSQAGDGTTSSVVIARAIAEEGIKAISAGVSVMDVKRGIDMAVETVIEDLEKRSKDVSTNEEIAQVGIISANGDEEIGNNIAKAMEEVGKDGVLTVEDASGLESSIEIKKGYITDKGFESGFFVTNPEKMKVEMSNPAIFLSEMKLTELQSMLPMLEALVTKPLVIISPECSGSLLSGLVVNKLQAGLSVASTKAPGFGDRQKEALYDLAVLTGATVFHENIGYGLENLTAETVGGILGRADKVEMTKDETIIVGGGGSPEDIESHAEQLRLQIEQADNEYDKEKLEERLAKLTGGIALLRVGGASTADQGERKFRYEDAVCATKAAVKEGILPGGGLALLRAKKAVQKLKTDNDDIARGIAIVEKALEAPIRQIAENAGVEGSVIVGDLLREKNEKIGWNAQTGEYEDLIETGVIDPTLVVKTVLRAGASASGILLTTGVAVTDIPEKEAAPEAAMPGMGY